MSYEKSTHLKNSIHKKLKKKAFDRDSTIVQVLDDILEKEFMDDENYV